MRNVGLKLRMLAAGTGILGVYLVVIMPIIGGFTPEGSAGVLLMITLTAVLTAGAVAASYRVGFNRITESGDRPLSADQHPELHNRARQLAQRMDIEVPDIRIRKMDEINAFAMGRQKNGYVVLSEKTLHELNVDELEGILAHEFAHVRNRDSIVLTIASTMTAIVGGITRWVMLIFGIIIAGFVVAIRRKMGARRRTITSRQRYRIERAALLIRNLVMGFLTLFTRSLSRQREYVADEAAVRFTGKPMQMRSALRKIETEYQTETTTVGEGSQESGHKSERKSVPDALCIYARFDGMLNRLFATHPSLDSRRERIAATFPGREFQPLDLQEYRRSPSRGVTETGQAGQKQTQRQSARQERSDNLQEQSSGEVYPRQPTGQNPRPNEPRHTNPDNEQTGTGGE